MCATITTLKGNCPTIITVPHDGNLIARKGQTIPIRRSERCNDEGTAYLAGQISNIMEHMFSKKPFVLFQNIERKRLTRSFILDFYSQVLKLVSDCFDFWGRCYLFDIHGFKSHMEIGEFDIILGTNHRATILNNLDFRLATNLTLKKFEEKKMRVYVPNIFRREGEKFSATKHFPLANWIKKTVPRINSLQIEIYKNWLMLDERTDFISKALAYAIATSAI